MEHFQHLVDCMLQRAEKVVKINGPIQVHNTLFSWSNSFQRVSRTVRRELMCNSKGILRGLCNLVLIIW